ncbi:MAG: Hsp20/alpha crystallin family protein [Pseudomonadota bacterium]|nr:Hsp20/alpha crystallin family protein [Pseudomonadota bacterium]
MLTTYEPWRLLNQFYRDLNQNVNAEDDSKVALYSWVPAVDIKEESQQFVVDVDIPGVDPKDIEVSMENSVLIIKGERILEHQNPEYKRAERVHGRFYRRFSLPDTADAEHITATGKNGVLTITIPKKPVAQPRRIEVSVH